ncbi:MAG TPA: nucleoside triphosphate pyrophosphohydrolase [Bacteroidia bacterium]|nr:nucleoside triphosphate pyrophosphohydrolase [Bacteroidia bacterium]
MDPRAESFLKLLKIMDELREQCPWDKKQTLESIRHLSIEETYELSDAILKGDMQEIRKELGDILLHIVFYARIASESQAFDIRDVIESLCEKLIFRHPHIYDDVKVKDDEEVKQNWEQLKQKEKNGNKSVLAGVPSSLPALLKAYRIQEKARAVGFDWEEPSQVFAKVKEELEEFEQEVKAKHREEAEKEFGDILFSLINYARFLDINPEDALEQTNRKFIHRFTYMEEQVKARGKAIADCKLEELDLYWNEAKKI